jgi:hypothetical protein
MESRRGIWGRGAVVVAVTAGLMMTASSAFGLLTGFGGSSASSVRAVTQTSSSFTQGPAWVSLPGAELMLPAKANSTIRARFSGESVCANVQAAGVNHCRTRIVLVNAAGAVVEFHPQSGLDYLWDNTVDGRVAEAQASERLLRIGAAGNYVLRVQYNTTNPVTRLTLDDWTFTADAIAP